MPEINTVLFLVVVLLGALVQTVTGFAMGLIIMAGVALFGIVDIAFGAAVVSFISLVNTAVALRKGYLHIDRRMVLTMLVGLLPAIGLGLVLLSYLSANYYEMLKLILGLVVIFAGAAMMISPAPFRQRSSGLAFGTVGLAGGLLGGLFSAGGPPLAYFAYRQPFSIDVIRFSLLAVFAVSTIARLLMIGVTGQITVQILQMSLLAIPLVIAATLFASRFLHLIPDRAVRLVVFCVLLMSGLMLVIASLLSGELPFI